MSRVFARFLHFLVSEGGLPAAAYLYIVKALYNTARYPQRIPGPFWAIFGAKLHSGPSLQNCCSELLTGSRGSILVALEPCARRA